MVLNSLFTGFEETIFDNIKILLVEDNPHSRQVTSDFLKSKFKMVFVSSSGAEGLAIFKKERPDIVITNIIMQDMYGLDMARAMKEVRDIPVIVMTGLDDKNSLFEAIDVGIDAYLVKPVNNSKLLGLLERFGKTVLQEKMLSRGTDFIKTTMNAIPNYLLITDGKDIEYFNSSFLKFMGFNSIVEYQKSKKHLNDYIIEEEASFYKGKIFNQWVVDLIEHPDIEAVIHMQCPHDTDKYTFLVHTTQLDNTDRYLLTFTDITLLEIIKSLYKELSMRDSLTHIFNRKKFMMELEKDMDRSRRYKNSLTLTIFDIDHFKKVNDNYGHQIGDEVILKIVESVRADIRKPDIFGRYGGEEFILYFPETNIDGAFLTANRLRRIISELDFAPVNQVTCSFGVAEYRHGESIDSFIHRADIALYVAKDNGRNRVELESDNLKPEAQS